MTAGPGGHSMRGAISAAVGDERIEAIFHREQQASLDDPTFVWHRYERIREVPDRRLAGWEELLVYTETRVYHWVETGFSSGPTVLPRDPATVRPTPSFAH